MNRRVGYAAAWLLAVVVATAVGLAAVSTVGASVRGRGPLGSEVGGSVESLETGPVKVDPKASAVERPIKGDWGTFLVECRGVYAFGKRATPAAGWRLVSYEKGPDDDVDAVFSSGGESVDLEVYCNRGRPTVGDQERNTLPEDD